ncbi:MAG TPA: signal peptidase I [bacterium]|nr:signal peptidase I [bacterium]HPQ65590.1 signal peptidase I [bacterium]
MTIIARYRVKKASRDALRSCRWILRRRRPDLSDRQIQLLEKAAGNLRESLRRGKPEETRQALNRVVNLLDGEFKGYRKSKVREYAESIFWALFVVFLLRTFVVEPFKIPTGSMEPTLLGVERVCPVCGYHGGYYDEICPRDKVELRNSRMGDRILVNKFLYGAKTPDRIPFTSTLLPYLQLPALRSPRRGDIVVFHYPEDERQDYVKRLIGFPGETLEISEGKVYVDGRPLAAKPFSKVYYTNDGPLGAAGRKVTVPYAGMRVPLSVPLPGYWRRLIASEGHRVQERGGEVLIDGTGAREYTVEGDYYFMLGDHSDNSRDSRFWGFVPERNLVGSVFMIYWPPSRWGFPR